MLAKISLRISSAFCSLRKRSSKKTMLPIKTARRIKNAKMVIPHSFIIFSAVYLSTRRSTYHKEIKHIFRKKQEVCFLKYFYTFSCPSFSSSFFLFKRGKTCASRIDTPSKKLKSLSDTPKPKVGGIP
jgi:hypothetical protein